MERSLHRLGTDYLDLVLVHSDGNDLDIIHEHGTLEMLKQLQREGLVRACGMSTKTVAGGLEAARCTDVVMLTYNLAAREEEPVLDACARLGRGALIKKALASGHLSDAFPDPVAASMALVFGHPGSSAAIIGTINPAHLASNVAAARKALGLA